ncbi:hypothetical protein TSUD_337430 [Trifolium subterraneum]|uniref:Uncharacterized protein n=1 Tax=Trifolium subterraneum TaxID=3900 RepID=A0A2Z6MVG8_TRISU|nr:hypothetical protein TSUD_337430 [Trifolium subterraneum]
MGGMGQLPGRQRTGDQGEWIWVSRRRRKATGPARTGQDDLRHFNGHDRCDSSLLDDDYGRIHGRSDCFVADYRGGGYDRDRSRFGTRHRDRDRTDVPTSDSTLHSLNYKTNISEVPKEFQVKGGSGVEQFNSGGSITQPLTDAVQKFSGSTIRVCEICKTKFDRFVREVNGEGVGGGRVDEGEKIRVEKKIKRVACDVVVVDSICKRELDRVKEEAIVSEEERVREMEVRMGVDGREEKEAVMPSVEEVKENVVEGEMEVNEQKVWKYMPFEEDVIWAGECSLAKLSHGYGCSFVQQALVDAGLENITLIPLGGDKVLVHPHDVIYERGAWVHCFGVLVHAWNNIFFAELAESHGRLLKIDECTSNKSRMDYARFKIATHSLKEINVSFQVLIDNRLTSIRLIEDIDFEFASDACLVTWGGVIKNRVSPKQATSLQLVSEHSVMKSEQRVSHGSSKSLKLKKCKFTPSIKGMKKLARLSAADRNALIPSLKNAKRRKPGSSSVKVNSQGKQGTSLTAGSSFFGKDTGSKDWNNWVALHGDEQTTQRDVAVVGNCIGVKCSNSFEVLDRGKGRVREKVVMKELVLGCVGKLANIFLQVDEVDIWVWKLHSSQSYSVKSAYSYLSASETRISDSFDRSQPLIFSVPSVRSVVARDIEVVGHFDGASWCGRCSFNPILRTGWCIKGLYKSFYHHLDIGSLSDLA